MKKPFAAVSTVALAGFATLALAGPATAATPLGDATFFTTADFGVESGGYPAEEWFFGQLGGGWTAGTATSSATGLEVASPGTTTALQILNQDVTTPTSAADFINAIDDVWVEASGAGWSFQLPLFGEPGTEFTTLRPAVLGDSSSSVQWITSGAITDGAGNTLYAAGSTDNLTDIADALYQGAAPEVLAYGLWIQDTTLEVWGISGFGDVSAFTAVPTRSITPNPATPQQAVDGLTVSGTGWFPGADVYFDVYDCGTTVVATDFDFSTVAGPDGTFSVQVAFGALPAAGTYCADFSDGHFLFNHDVLPDVSFVIADAVVDEEDDEELAATGAQDVTPWLIGAGALLLLGAGAVVLGARRRQNQH